jgi:hypothetical protein
MNTIDCLKERLRDSLSDEAHGSLELAKLVDGENTVTNKISLGGSKVGEDKTRTIAEDDTFAEVNGLEVLGLSRS